MMVSNSIIQRALKNGNPVIDTDHAIFIWEGDTAPYLTSDLNHWDDNPRRFKRVSPRLIPDSAKSIWSCTLTLPRDVYVEYAFHDPVTQMNFLDPLNKKSVSNGVTGRNNYFYMPETMPSPFAMRRADVTPGALTSHRVETKWLREDYEREIHFYRPPVKGPVPLLVVFDGQDYLQRGKLAVIVDNLIAEGRIQPFAMAFLTSGGRWRNVEYACSDGTILWMNEIILPLAQEKLNLLDVKKYPGAYSTLGASLGGTMAFYAGLRLPDVFGKVLSQSGAFTIPSRDLAVVDLVRHGQARDMDLWMDVGVLDFLLEDNRKMYSLLQEKEYNVSYREYSGGHNYTSWRDDVWRGLEAMFPSPR
ncbi:MAG TPA: esterase [Anaerolineae bacterium]|nr:esterase [Anaerolineae bacterium]